ncbi:MAG: hypothetical protein Tsb0021_11280 [Chlamydiales bacterium]
MMSYTLSRPSSFVFCYVAAGLALLSGLILTILSWLQICVEACSEVHLYKFFGVSFEFLGLLFFSAALIAHGLSWIFKKITIYSALIVYSGLGAEVHFVLIQKYVIGQWCPVCLSIAASVALASLMYTMMGFREEFMSLKEKEDISMTVILKRGALSISAFMIGFLIAAFGVAKTTDSYAEGIAKYGDLAVGNPNSNVNIYFFTDWYCSACTKVEPRIEKMLPELTSQAKVTFVDLPVHPSSINYTPYNLSFMIFNKEKYPELRRALHNLSKKTKAPTNEQVQNAIQPYGVKYKQLNYYDVDSGIKYFQKLAKTYNIKRTPVVVIANKNTLQSKKFVGPSQITEENILKAINDVK